MAAAAVVLLVLAVVTSTPALVPLAVVAAVPVLVAPTVAGRRARRAAAVLAVHVHVVPATCAVGEPARATVTLVGRGRPARGARPGPVVPRLWWAPPAGRWRRRGGGSAGEAERGLVAPSALVPLPVPAAGSRSSLVLRVPTDERGVWVLPAAPTWAMDPFGLFAAPGAVIPPATAVVHPRPDRSVPWPRAAAGRSTQIAPAADQPGTRRSGDAGELIGVRPYREGDRLSLLHWPLRARYGTWYVRELAPDLSPPDLLVLDDRAGVHRRQDFDALAALALGLVEGAVAAGRAVTVRTLSGRRIEVSGPDGRFRARVAMAEILPATSVGDGVLDPGAAVVLTTPTAVSSLGAPGAGLATKPTVIVAGAGQPASVAAGAGQPARVGAGNGPGRGGLPLHPAVAGWRDGGRR